MRLITFVFLFCTTVFTYGQTPDYFANNPSWVCGLWNVSMWVPVEYSYRLNGDTIIGGNTYHCLYSGNNPTGYYLRQDNNSIRFISNQIGVGTDSLLVSYDYQVGDTVKGYIFQACGINQDTIQKIDSILINSEYRKVFYLDSLNGPVVTEGIGHQWFLNGDIGELVYPLCQGSGFDYFIYCYGQGSTPYWDSYGTNGNCILNVGVEENVNNKVDIYPNPFDDYLYVNALPYSISEITLYDLSSRMVLQQLIENDKYIQTSNLDRGIYFYEVRFKNESIDYGKLVKE